MTDYNAVFLYAMMANAIVSFFIPVERGRQFVVVILGVVASNIAWLILFDMTPLLIFALFWLVSDNAADYQGLAQRIADPESAGILFQKALQWCLSLNMSVAVYLWVVRGFHHDWKDSIFKLELIRNMLTQYGFDRQSWDMVSLRFSSKPKTD